MCAAISFLQKFPNLSVGLGLTVLASQFLQLMAFPFTVCCLHELKKTMVLFVLILASLCYCYHVRVPFHYFIILYYFNHKRKIIFCFSFDPSIRLTFRGMRALTLLPISRRRCNLTLDPISTTLDVFGLWYLRRSLLLRSFFAHISSLAIGIGLYTTFYGMFCVTKNVFLVIK